MPRSNTTPRSRKIFRQPGFFALLALSLAMPALADEPRHYPRGGERSSDDAYQLRLRLGVFELDGRSAFWDDSFGIFTGSRASFDDVEWGVDFNARLSYWWDLQVSGTSYESATGRSYRDYTDGFGDEVVHEAGLSLSSLTVAAVLYPLGRGRTFTPYVGIGGGFYSWDYYEIGDFIDFDVDPAEVISAGFEARGVTMGRYLMAGLDIPISADWKIFVEGRWTRVDDQLADDFDGFGTIDLSGRTVSVGFSYSF